MFRTHTCGELSLKNLNEKVTLSGWVSVIRDKGFMVWIDVRDRYGITQLIIDEERSDKSLFETANKLGREFVIQVSGTVIERASKNPNLPTGEIEILVEKLEILNESKLPPFTIEDQTDGGEELRMQYRYLDIRRNPVKNKLISGEDDATFLGEDKEWLIQYSKKKLESKHRDYFVFGHRHLPLEILLNHTSKYINLGDWITYYTYGVFDGETFELKTFEFSEIENNK